MIHQSGVRIMLRKLHKPSCRAALAHAHGQMHFHARSKVRAIYRFGQNVQPVFRVHYCNANIRPYEPALACVSNSRISKILVPLASPGTDSAML
jgi:hypothetical protein